MPVKAPTLRPSWTGFHVGAALGARRTDAQWTTELTGGFPPNADNEALIDSNAVHYGTYLGYDRQFGNFVAGLEGAFGDAVNAQRMHIGVPGLGGTLPGFGNTDSVTVTSRWDASVVARLGALIAPDTLAYGLGGVAFQNIRIDAVCGSTTTDECFLDHAERVSTTRTGWTVGGGLETMFAPHWLARFDYRHADLGTIRHTFFVDEVIQSPVSATHVRTHTASFGLAYKARTRSLRRNRGAAGCAAATRQLVIAGSALLHRSAAATQVVKTVL